MSNTGVEFLLFSPDGTPWVPTQAWAVADEVQKDAIDQWHMVLDPPAKTGPPTLALHDLKRWLLFSAKPSRFLTIGVDKRGNANVRRIEREIAAERYLRVLVERITAARRDARVSVLMPALDDENARRRYLAVIRRALPNARVFPEPEMIVEYFRLVQRSLVLDPKRNNVVLVVDIGASTSNLTMVLSNREDEIIGAETGIQRHQRLQAIQGTCGSSAGQWVDERIAALAGLELDAELTEGERLAALREIEAAKITVSRSGEDTAIRDFTLKVEHLHKLANDVAVALKPVLNVMRQRLWKQLTGTAAARKLSADDRERRGVQGEEDALKLVDVVLLAGGTCRLRGFRDALRELLPDTAPNILEVGDSFPIAAAVGALAHVLTEKYRPPRLRDGAAASKSEPEPPPPLDGALDVDIELAWRPDSAGQVERREVMLERGDPIVYETGTRDRVAELNTRRFVNLLGRFIPNSAKKGDRRGLQPAKLRSLRHWPGVGFEVNGDRELRLRSEDLQGANAVWLDLRRFSTIFEAPPPRPAEAIPVDALVVDDAPEVVIDFGMSKTVMLAPKTGWLRPAELAAIRVAPVVETTTPVPIMTPRPPDAPVSLAPPPVSDEPPTAPPSTPADALAAPEDAEPAVGLPAHLPFLPPDVPPVPTGKPEARIPRSEPQTATRARPTPAYPDPPHPPDPLALPDFASRLKLALDHEIASELALPRATLTALLLALATRPNVLLAGPPGCGKSTLGRVAAHLLGLEPDVAFHEVPVQAHWTTDRPLFHSERGLLRGLLERPAPRHLVLFDEVNLTRPEFFLARFYHAQESHHGRLAQGRAGNWLTVGTLNIDDTSRPPSPKVVDRCFLLEIDAEPAHRRGPRVRERLPELPRVLGLPKADLGATLPEELEERVARVVDVMKKAVKDHHVRQDVLPSRRAMDDVYGFVALAVALDALAPGLLAPVDALDWAIESRILVRICGAVEQLKPLLDAMTEEVVPEQLKRSYRRMKLFEAQRSLGFVSPWQ